MFIPALLCGKVARTAADMQTFGVAPWLVLAPLSALVQIGLQLPISRALLRCVARVDVGSPKGRVMRLAMLFPNSAMPLLFCQALFRGHAETQMLAEGAVSFYLIGWSSTFWTAGFALLKGAAPEADGDAEEPISVEAGQASPAERRTGKWRELFGRILSPPVCGVLAGLAAGLLPPLRWLLVPHTGRPTPPLGFFFFGLENLGRAAIPASQLVLSGSLARGLAQAWAAARTSAPSVKTPKEYSWNLRDLLAVCLSRIVFGPVFCGFGFCFCLRSLGFMPEVPGVDQVLFFVLLLEASMPSAQNSIVIPNLLQRPKMAAGMAQLLLAVYMIALPCVSLWLALGLHWTGLKGGVSVLR